MSSLLSRELLAKCAGIISLVASAFATVVGVSASILSVIRPQILESADKFTIEEIYRRTLFGHVSIISIILTTTTLVYALIIILVMKNKLKIYRTMGIDLKPAVGNIQYRMGDEKSIHDAIELLKKQLDDRQNRGS